MPRSRPPNAALALGNLTIADSPGEPTTLTLSGAEYSFADVTTPQESTIVEVLLRIEAAPTTNVPLALRRRLRHDGGGRVWAGLR